MLWLLLWWVLVIVPFMMIIGDLVVMYGRRHKRFYGSGRCRHWGIVVVVNIITPKINQKDYKNSTTNKNMKELSCCVHSIYIYTVKLDCGDVVSHSNIGWWAVNVGLFLLSHVVEEMVMIHSIGISLISRSEVLLSYRYRMHFWFFDSILGWSTN